MHNFCMMYMYLELLDDILLGVSELCVKSGITYDGTLYRDKKT